jgi:hypothetical protein
VFFRSTTDWMNSLPNVRLLSIKSALARRAIGYVRATIGKPTA